jgi:hypothetical protein
MYEVTSSIFERDRRILPLQNLGPKEDYGYEQCLSFSL